MDENEQLAALRQALLDTITDKDFEAALEALMREGRKGNVAAITLFLDYALGPPAVHRDKERPTWGRWMGETEHARN